MGKGEGRRVGPKRMYSLRPSSRMESGMTDFRATSAEPRLPRTKGAYAILNALRLSVL
jgi:hypothetical protein